MGPNDTFAFNDAFTSPLARIKIMQIASKVETPKEREETQEMVDEERKHQVEVGRAHESTRAAQRRVLRPSGCIMDGVLTPGMHRADYEGAQDDAAQRSRDGGRAAAQHAVPAVDGADQEAD